MSSDNGEDDNRLLVNSKITVEKLEQNLVMTRRLIKEIEERLKANRARRKLEDSRP
jgi:predicted ATP-grasp superfamily ATP-dependent carboligase